MCPYVRWSLWSSSASPFLPGASAELAGWHSLKPDSCELITILILRDELYLVTKDLHSLYYDFQWTYMLNCITVWLLTWLSIYNLTQYYKNMYAMLLSSLALSLALFQSQSLFYCSSTFSACLKNSLYFLKPPSLIPLSCLVIRSNI